MDEEIKKLLEDNLRLNQETFKMVKSVKKFLLFQQIMGIIKLLLIVIPLIIGIIYLPPLLKQSFDQYQQLLGIGQSDLSPNSLLNNGINIQSILEQYKADN